MLKNNARTAMTTFSMNQRILQNIFFFLAAELRSLTGVLLLLLLWESLATALRILAPAPAPCTPRHWSPGSPPLARISTPGPRLDMVTLCLQYGG